MKKRLTAWALVLALALTSFTAAAKTEAAALTILTEAVYDETGAYADGLIWVREGAEYSYLGDDGGTAISAAALKAACESADIIGVSDFSEGFAVLYTASRAVYIDKQGKAVFSADWGYTFSDGAALAWSGADCVLYDASGTPLKLTPPTEAAQYADWDCGVNFTEGLLPFWVFSGGSALYGYVDKTFTLKIPFTYEDARPFNQGLAPVKQNGKWGFIDTAGNLVTEALYDDFMTAGSAVFHEGLAAVKKDGLWGYIDTQGKTVIPFSLESVGVFTDGLSPVGEAGVYGYIDKTGNMPLPATYSDVNPFFSGTALVGDGGTYRLIAPDGSRISYETWDFDGTLVNVSAPGVVVYKRGDKWGVAKITVSENALDSAAPWARERLTAALEMGFVPQDLQGAYTQPILRGEFARFALKWVEVTTGKDAETLLDERGSRNVTFSDTDDPELLLAANLGLIDGSGGMFNPEGTFNRRQSARLICNVLAAMGTDVSGAPPAAFGDIADTPEWAKSAIDYVSHAGIMTGTGENTFDPMQVYSRAQAIITFAELEKE